MRIAHELQTNLGHAVGYKIRFGDHVSDNTSIKLMTDGILLAEIQSDRLLRGYDTLIIDEAHERSLNIDFLIGYLQRLLPAGPISSSSSPARPSIRSASAGISMMRRSSKSRGEPTRWRFAIAR